MRGGLGISLIILLHHLQGSLCIVDENKLLTTLFSGYNSDSRPVEFFNETLTVTVELALKQIISLTESSETLTVNFWLRLYWYDHHLQWDPDQYGGIQDITVKPSRIWKPDLKLYDDASDAYDLVAYQEYYRVNIKQNGQVKWTVPYIYSTSCSLNMQYFPFDKQQCSLQLGPWRYPMDKIDLRNSSASADLKLFVCHGEWQLLGMPVKRHVEKYGLGIAYVDLTYTLTILRKPLFNVFNMIYPCLLLTASAMLVFCLPPESGEKLNLGVTVLLAQVVLLLVVAEHIPQQSDTIPLASWLFGMNVALLATSTAMTVITLNLHHRDQMSPPVPNIIQFLFFDCFGRMLLMGNVIKKHKKAKEDLEREKSNIQASTSDKIKTSVDTELYRERYVIENHEERHSQQNENPQHGTPGSSASDSYIARISNALQHFQESGLFDKEEKLQQSEWILLAKVTDRILFILFLVGTIVCVVVIVGRMPDYSSELSQMPIPCRTFD